MTCQHAMTWPLLVGTLVREVYDGRGDAPAVARIRVRVSLLSAGRLRGLGVLATRMGVRATFRREGGPLGGVYWMELRGSRFDVLRFLRVLSRYPWLRLPNSGS